MKKKFVVWAFLLLGAQWSLAQQAHQAAARGQVAVLDSLVRANPDVLAEKAPRNGGTPLHYAAWAGQVETVKWLADHGANIHAKDPNGRDPLAWAVSNGKLETLKVLAALGADPLMPHDRLGSSLHLAALSGTPELIGFLVDKGAPINGAGRFGFTPLHYAVFQKKSQNIAALLTHGADALAPNNDGLSPLLMAIDGGDTSCVSAFLASGVSPNTQSAEGDTPLHAAVYGGRLAMVAALLHAGAEVNRPDGLGRYPLDIAQSRGHEEVSMLLKTHGASLAQSRTAAKPVLPPAGPAETPLSDSLTLTVIYDNTTHRPDLEGDWGFSVLVEIPGFHLLFDTGTKETLFLQNFDALNLHADAIDMVMISHEHGDHTGGLAGFLNRQTAIPVVVPHAFSYGMVRRIEKAGALPVARMEPVVLYPGFYTSGQLGQAIPEQALVVHRPYGLVVVTGCSHPGIVEMLRAIKAHFQQPVHTVLGGFHLMNSNEPAIARIIADMRDLGVVRCGATHCTGEAQIAQFKEAFGPDYVALGVGNVIRL